MYAATEQGYINIWDVRNTQTVLRQFYTPTLISDYKSGSGAPTRFEPSQYLYSDYTSNTLYDYNNNNRTANAVVSLCLNENSEQLGFQMKDSSFGCLDLMSRELLFFKSDDGIFLLAPIFSFCCLCFT